MTETMVMLMPAGVILASTAALVVTLIVLAAIAERHLMTKSDLKEAFSACRQENRQAYAAIGENIRRLGTELKTEMGELRTELKTEMGEVKTEVRSIVEIARQTAEDVAYIKGRLDERDQTARDAGGT